MTIFLDKMQVADSSVLDYFLSTSDGSASGDGWVSEIRGSPNPGSSVSQRRLSAAGESMLWGLVGMLFIGTVIYIVKTEHHKRMARSAISKKKGSKGDLGLLPVYGDSPSLPPAYHSNPSFYRTSATQARLESESVLKEVKCPQFGGTAMHLGWTKDVSMTETSSSAEKSDSEAAAAPSVPADDYRRFLRATFFTETNLAEVVLKTGARPPLVRQTDRSPTYHWIVGGAPTHGSNVKLAVVHGEGSGTGTASSKTDLDVSQLAGMDDYEEFEEGYLAIDATGDRTPLRAISRDLSPELYQELQAFSDRHAIRHTARQDTPV
jgi:hypothetical protein